MLISKYVRATRIINVTWRSLSIITIISIASFIFYDSFLKLHFEFLGIIPTVLGTALAFFIGFNNNQAYDRWWEARKIWGALVNDSRTWARQIIYYTSITDGVDERELNDFRRKTIFRHIAFLYALKENLRKSTEKEYKKYLSQKEFDAIELESNKHNAILSFQSKDLEYLYKKGVVDGFRFTELNKMIIAFCDEMGKSERIKNTVFPTTYQTYTFAFIWLFIASITIVTAYTLGIWSVLVGILIGSVFVITHSIGLALLNPFEEIITGIPLNQITRTIEINLLESLGDSDIPKPVESVNNEYVM